MLKLIHFTNLRKLSETWISEKRNMPNKFMYNIAKQRRSNFMK